MWLVDSNNERALRFLQIFEGNSGVLLDALEKCDWTYLEHCRAMEEDSGYRKAVTSIEERLVHIGIKTIADNARNGDQRAAEYLVNQKGKRLGWGNSEQINTTRTINLNIFTDQKVAIEESQVIDGHVSE